MGDKSGVVFHVMLQESILHSNNTYTHHRATRMGGQDRRPSVEAILAEYGTAAVIGIIVGIHEQRVQIISYDRSVGQRRPGASLNLLSQIKRLIFLIHIHYQVKRLITWNEESILRFGQFVNVAQLLFILRNLGITLAHRHNFPLVAPSRHHFATYPLPTLFTNLPPGSRNSVY
jgi:hypothetical protein